MRIRELVHLMLILFLSFTILNLLPSDFTFKILNVEAASGWFFPDFAYRRQHNITGSAVGSITNYQMSVTIKNGTGTASGGVMYTENVAQPDFDDVRFTWYNYTSGQEQEVDFWVETINTGVDATFWIEIPEITNVADNIIYVYYGNSIVSTISDGETTFLFFDDFSGTSLDTTKWNVIQGDVSVGGGILKLTGGQAVRGLIDGKTSFSPGVAVYTRTEWSTIRAVYHHFCGFRGAGSWSNRVDVAGQPADYQVVFDTYKAGSYTSTALYLSTVLDYHIYKVFWRSGQGKFYQDDSLKATHTTNIPTTPLVPVLYEGNTAGQDVYIDWIFVRNYVDPEPTHGAWGAEETVGLQYDITTSIDVSQVWTKTVQADLNILTDLPCIIQLGIVLQAFFTSIFTFTFDVIFQVLMQRILSVNPVLVLSQVFTVMTETGYNLVFLWSLDQTWTTIMETSYNVAVPFVPTIEWVTSVEVLILILVDLVLPLTQTFQVLTKTSFNIIATMNVEVAWAVLLTSSFNILTSISHTITLAIEAIKGLAYFVELSLLVSVSLALEVIKAIAPVVTGIGIAMIALLIALFALALSLMRD